MDRVSRVVGWMKPDRNALKANWDSAYCTRRKMMGIGIVIRDCNGEMIVALSNNIDNVASPKRLQKFMLSQELCNCAQK